MTTYPALLMIARGSHVTGYRGVVRLVYGSLDQAGDRDLVECSHAHRMTRTARDCASSMAQDWARYRRLTKAEIGQRAQDTRDHWSEGGG